MRSAAFGLPFRDPPREAAPLAQRRFDPTKIVILLVAAAVVIGVVVAFQMLTKPMTQRLNAAPRPVATSVGPSKSSGPSASSSGPTSSAPSAPAVGGVPVIASVSTIDPSDPAGEHPELAARAVDGNPATAWYTRTYNRPDFGGYKPAVGFVLNLAARSTVKSVTLHVNGAGGGVEVRATDAVNPTAGPVLASGPLAADTVLTLTTPTPTSSIVLWFTSLAQTADGSNRIEITEITVS